MKHYDGIIFDLDGTLWDVAETTTKGWNSVLESRGLHDLKITSDDVRKVMGKPFNECLQILFPKLSISSNSEMFAALDAGEKAAIELYGVRVFENVVDGIEQLAKHYRLFLISNCQAWYLESFWKQVNVQQFFEGWDCNGLSGDPKATMIKNLVHRYELSKPIYVGDTEGDKLACNAAGVDFAYVSYGFGQVENPLVFSLFEELVTWFQTPHL